MDQFWSPLTNDLDGPYGGSLENRMRFTFDILRGIRQRVGEDFLLGWTSPALRLGSAFR